MICHFKGITVGDIGLTGNIHSISVQFSYETIVFMAYEVDEISSSTANDILTFLWDDSCCILWYRTIGPTVDAGNQPCKVEANKGIGSQPCKLQEQV